MSKKELQIETPKEETLQVETKNGKCTAKLEWNPGFAPRMTGQLNAAQAFLDSEVLRGCSSYVPHATGNLEKSGILGTVIGSGVVRWIAPYAAAQYYNTALTRPGQPNRGAYWFARWKADHAKSTIAKVKKIGGGKN